LQLCAGALDFAAQLSPSPVCSPHLHLCAALTFTCVQMLSPSPVCSSHLHLCADALTFTCVLLSPSPVCSSHLHLCAALTFTCVQLSPSPVCSSHLLALVAPTTILPSPLPAAASASPSRSPRPTLPPATAHALLSALLALLSSPCPALSFLSRAALSQALTAAPVRRLLCPRRAPADPHVPHIPAAPATAATPSGGHNHGWGVGEGGTWDSSSGARTCAPPFRAFEGTHPSSPRHLLSIAALASSALRHASLACRLCLRGQRERAAAVLCGANTPRDEVEASSKLLMVAALAFDWRCQEALRAEGGVRAVGAVVVARVEMWMGGREDSRGSGEDGRKGEGRAGSREGEALTDEGRMSRGDTGADEDEWGWVERSDAWWEEGELEGEEDEVMGDGVSCEARSEARSEVGEGGDITPLLHAHQWHAMPHAPYSADVILLSALSPPVPPAPPIRRTAPPHLATLRPLRAAISPTHATRPPISPSPCAPPRPPPPLARSPSPSRIPCRAPLPRGPLPLPLPLRAPSTPALPCRACCVCAALRWRASTIGAPSPVARHIRSALCSSASPSPSSPPATTHTPFTPRTSCPAGARAHVAFILSHPFSSPPSSAISPQQVVAHGAIITARCPALLAPLKVPSASARPAPPRPLPSRPAPPVPGKVEGASGHRLAGEGGEGLERERWEARARAGAGAGGRARAHAGVVREVGLGKGVTAEAFSQLLEYIYTGQVSLSHSPSQDLLQLAMKCRLDGLVALLRCDWPIWAKDDVSGCDLTSALGPAGVPWSDVVLCVPCHCHAPRRHSGEHPASRGSRGEGGHGACGGPGTGDEAEGRHRR
ncbi:hypothetical protein CLOP_g20158, partial [Closterium sp. NIES-67]